MPSDLYTAVLDYVRQTAMLTAIQNVLDWDANSYLPEQAGEYRAEQVTYLAGMIHKRWVDPQFGENLDRLAADPAFATASNEKASDEAINVRRLKRVRDKQTKLPQKLVEELAHTSSRGQQVWKTAREKNDFPLFRPYLEKMVALKKEQAAALGFKETAYDALLDEYEPEERTANVTRVLAALREELVPLVAAIQKSKKKPNAAILTGSFPKEIQRQFGIDAAKAIGFDFTRGRLDETAHPFCTTLGPHDCRILTDYKEDNLSESFYSILHEAGHGLYEQGLPPEQHGLPLGEATSLGLHESQSRLWENIVGRSMPFWKYFLPIAKKYFPGEFKGAVESDIYFAVNEVKPSLIRTEADEVTYNLHILIRFELEQAMLSGDLNVADAPAAWNEKYKKYLGVTPPSDADGILQDVHWSAGLIGYFPTYTLGNLYSAQFYAKAEEELGDLPAHFARGEFQPLREWLREKIHRYGQRFTASELVQRATGKPLSHEPLLKYLRTKLEPLYF